MIRVEGLTKTYGTGSAAVTAVDDVSLAVEPGKIYGILGRSGAGKTTLMRCLTALERPSTGTIQVAGVELTTLTGKQLRASRHRMGMIFQHFNLFNSRTAANNVAFPLEIQKMPRSERDARVSELLELVGLGDKGDAWPSQLSGGQKQRVGIARALAAGPDVLFCDEATSALDPTTTEQILDLLAEINRKTGVTIVMITHEAEVVRRICDSAALMEHGRVVESGGLVELLGNPESALADILLPVGSAEDNPQSVVLSFGHGHVTDPVISGLARDLGVDVSILGGSVEQIAGRQVGRLRVQFSKRDGELDQDAVAKYLHDREVRVHL